ncbi:MAG: SIS domain-containing protein [Actinomycetes bacterium]
MDPVRFLDDLEAKPAALAALAGHLRAENPWNAAVGRLGPEVTRVLMVGMGSSTFAAGVAAARLRNHGRWAVAEFASSALLPMPDPGTLVLAISASGASKETLEAARHYAGRCPVIALTNVADSAMSELADATVLMGAGPETGGVACRSFQHTLALLLSLEDRLCGTVSVLPDAVRRTGEACADLLDRRDRWLPGLVERLAGPAGTFVVAPASRLSSAQQSALMLREGPRRPATASETGEWNHVDVYLTKTLDYRMMLFPGSVHDDDLLAWTTDRGSTVVSVGADVAGATASLRYRHDSDELVRLLGEVLVAELVAQRLWAAV